MNNPLENRKNLLEAEDHYKSNFDYSEIGSKDKEKLIEYEKDLKSNQVNFIKSTLLIGETLKKAQDDLKNYVDGTFMSWYKNLGFNKDNVSYFLKRYNLSVEFPDKKNYIAEMPVRLVKELTKKNVEEELLKEAIEEEVKDNKDFLELKNKYSHGANTLTEKTIKMKVEKKEVEDILEKYLDEEKRREMIDIIFKKYKLTRR